MQKRICECIWAGDWVGAYNDDCTASFFYYYFHQRKLNFGVHSQEPTWALPPGNLSLSLALLWAFESWQWFFTQIHNSNLKISTCLLPPFCPFRQTLRRNSQHFMMTFHLFLPFKVECRFGLKFNKYPFEDIDLPFRGYLLSSHSLIYHFFGYCFSTCYKIRRTNAINYSHNRTDKNCCHPDKRCRHLRVQILACWVMCRSLKLA